MLAREYSRSRPDAHLEPKLDTPSRRDVQGVDPGSQTTSSSCRHAESVPRAYPLSQRCRIHPELFGQTVSAI